MIIIRILQKIIYLICSFLFKIIRAAITPGTHPHKVRINTIAIDPHPLFKTAKGGKITDKNT